MYGCTGWLCKDLFSLRDLGALRRILCWLRFIISLVAMRLSMSCAKLDKPCCKCEAFWLSLPSQALILQITVNQSRPIFREQCAYGQPSLAAETIRFASGFVLPWGRKMMLKQMSLDGLHPGYSNLGRTEDFERDPLFISPLISLEFSMNSWFWTDHLITQFTLGTAY